MNPIKLSIICSGISVCGMAVSVFAWDVGVKIACGALMVALLLVMIALYDTIDKFG